MNEPPVAGTGLHQWILESTRELLLTKGYSADDCHEKIFYLSQNKGRERAHLSREVWDAIDGCIRWMDAEGVEVDSKSRHEITIYRTYSGLESGRIDRIDRRPEYLPVNLPWQKQVCREFHKLGIEDLAIRNTREFDYHDLFELDFNLCFCVDVSRPMVKPLSDWQNLEGMQFTIPSPLLRCGVGGEVKCDDNMAKRTYQVVEFDQVASLDDQARLLWYLHTCVEGALVMIVHSGNKSLHGWFASYWKDARDIKTFFLEATKLGADPMLRIPSQYCRVPNGWNYKTGRRQQVLYWDYDLAREHNQIIRADCMGEDE